MDDLLSRLQAALEDRYRLERELGRGGAGVVYLAQDLKHDRKVALKVLSPEIAQSLGADRFLREIHIAAQLSHPHILALHDSGQADGLLYYVMPFVEGESLRARLDREHQLPVDETLRIGLEVADALAYAHSLGLVHRDIKPENILFQAGHAVLADFGIARAIGEAGGEKMTATGLALGTPTYMSPEQAFGEEVDHRSDLYSLGCVIYEMLAGGAPHSGPTPQVIFARKVTDSVADLRVVRDTIPLHIGMAVARVLAKTPADRIQSAEELAGALAGKIDVEPVGGPGDGTGFRTRNLAFGALGLVVAVLAITLATRDRGGALAPRIEVTPLTTQPGVEDSPSLSPDGMWVVYAGDVEGNRDVFLQGVGGRLPINLTEDSRADDYQPAFSADGEQIAFRSSRDGGGLFVMGRTGEAVRRVSRTGFNPSWSPDGTRIVFATETVDLMPLNWEGRSELWVVELESGQESRLTEGNAVQPSWSPDGRWVAYTARTRDPTQMDVWLQPAEGGSPVPITSGPSTDWAPTWSADGAFIYFVSDRAGSMNLWRIPVDQGSGTPSGAAEPITTPGSFVAHPSVSGDGTMVAYSSVQHTMNIEKAALDWVEGSLGDVTPLTSGSRQWSSPDPSPDGELVVFYSRDLPEGDLYVVRGDGTGLRQITGDEALDRVPRFSPDGSRITYFSTRSGRFQVWDTRPDGSGNRQLSFTENASSISTWSPDGAHIAVNRNLASDRADVVVFDAGSDWSIEGVRVLPQPDTELEDFFVNDWSHDGLHLAGSLGLSEQGVVIHTLETGEYERVTDFGHWPVWLPDSRHILFVSRGSEFHVVDTETGETRMIYSRLRDVLGPPRVTRDGREVVFSRRVTEGDIWLARMR